MDDDTRRPGMHPEVQRRWDAWARGIVAHELETYSDAVGYSIAKEIKARDAAFAERDQRLDALERRLEQLEGDEARVLNFSRVRGGKADAA